MPIQLMGLSPTYCTIHGPSISPTRVSSAQGPCRVPATRPPGPTSRSNSPGYGLWTLECVFRSNVGIHRAHKAIQVGYPRRGVLPHDGDHPTLTTQQVIQDYDTVFDNSIPFRKNDLLRITYFRIPVVPGTRLSLSYDRRSSISVSGGLGGTPSSIQYSVMFVRGNGVIRRTQKVIQGDDNGHVGRPCEVSLPGGKRARCVWFSVASPGPAGNFFYTTKQNKPTLRGSFKVSSVPCVCTNKLCDFVNQLSLRFRTNSPFLFFF